MTNPLLLFRAVHPRSRNRGRHHRDVDIPTTLPSTDAVFLVLRRMRVPLIVLVVIFSICVAGLALIPGQDADGNTMRMSVFEAFYFASYTASTIGYGEIPNAFTTAQRMWVTLSIYLLVVGWAYAIGSLLALVQEEGFRDALSAQRFRRRVTRLKEPFVLVVGYGETGQIVCEALDDDGRRLVVVDKDASRVERLAGDVLHADVPGLEGDGAVPAVLGLAGLDSPHLAMILALTDDDETNLAVVVSANLLRPDVPVIARVQDRATEARMTNFNPDAVINPNDRYGAFLVLSLQKPKTYQLLMWLMTPEGSAPRPSREELAQGRWLVCADGQFGEEIAHDLSASGLDVTVVDPATEHIDLAGAVGLIAGLESDLRNIALAERAKLAAPDIYVAVRQQSAANAVLVDALDVDSAFIPAQTVAHETLARVATPLFWGFVEHAMAAPEDWAQDLLDRLHSRCDARTPAREHVVLDRADAPAVVRWLNGHALTIGDLLRDPDDRDRPLGIVVLALVRGGERTYAPGDDVVLQVGDELLLAADRDELDALSDTLFHDTSVEYVATGRQVPTTWVGQLLTGRRSASRRR